MEHWYAIHRDNNGYSKEVARFDTLNDALDCLYKGAKRHNLEVFVDNTPDGSWGFCIWQIRVRVGDWEYYVTEETTESWIF